MNRGLKSRLARLEEGTRDEMAELAESMRYDAPIPFGSEEHRAALADPIKYRLAERPILCPDEQGPENPIL